jgi:hypothetical protein
VCYHLRDRPRIWALSAKRVDLLQNPRTFRRNSSQSTPRDTVPTIALSEVPTSSCTRLLSGCTARRGGLFDKIWRYWLKASVQKDHRRRLKDYHAVKLFVLFVLSLVYLIVEHDDSQHSGQLSRHGISRRHKPQPRCLARRIWQFRHRALTSADCLRKGPSGKTFRLDSLSFSR